MIMGRRDSHEAMCEVKQCVKWSDSNDEEQLKMISLFVAYTLQVYPCIINNSFMQSVPMGLSEKHEKKD